MRSASSVPHQLLVAVSATFVRFSTLYVLFLKMLLFCMVSEFAVLTFTPIVFRVMVVLEMMTFIHLEFLTNHLWEWMITIL